MKNDQFYTKPEIVDICIKELSKVTSIKDTYLEPSAGLGDFYNKLPAQKVGIDIDSPMFKPAVNFLTYAQTNFSVVVGNPPFGKNSSLAIQFFNKAAEFARIIAFILPRTFKKV